MAVTYKTRFHVAKALHDAIGAETFTAMLKDADSIPLIQFPDKPESLEGITIKDATDAGLLYTVKTYGFQKKTAEEKGGPTLKQNTFAFAEVEKPAEKPLGDAILIMETARYVPIREIAAILGKSAGKVNDRFA